MLDYTRYETIERFGTIDIPFSSPCLAGPDSVGGREAVDERHRVVAIALSGDFYGIHAVEPEIQAAGFDWIADIEPITGMIGNACARHTLRRIAAAFKHCLRDPQ